MDKGHTIKILDHGYVKYVDSMGSDEAIVEAARMSTGRGFISWAPYSRCKKCETVFFATFDRKVCRCWNNDLSIKNCDGTIFEHYPRGDLGMLEFMWKNRHCYDEQTEVLTDRGFIRWCDVTSKDLLGGWDASTDSLVYEAPIDLIRQRYKGQMYRVDHGGVDLLVTPEHTMLVKRIVRLASGKQGWSDQWALQSAVDLADLSMVRYRKHAAFRTGADANLSWLPPCDDPRALLRLIGFFVGDGHAGREEGTERNSITFHLKKSRKVAFLRETVTEVGWELRDLANNTYAVRAPNIAGIFREAFYDLDAHKRIPNGLLKLNEADATALLDGLRNSDGSQKRGAWEFFTSVKQVADAVEVLAMHAGEVCHRGGDGYMHRLMMMSRMKEPVINQGKRNTSLIEYDGEVFCAHTRTGVLVVRRQGKTVLSGNSTPFEFGELHIEVQAPIMVFREWHRHRTQAYSEFSARYSQMPDLHYLPELERCQMQSTTNHQGSAEPMHPEDAARLIEHMQRQQGDVYSYYDELVKAGIAKEVARLNTPVSRYSKMRAKTDLRNWLGFLMLRMAPGAQWEIRCYAQAVARMVEAIWPRTYALFEEHDLHGVHLSRTEAATLAALVNPDQVASVDFDVRKAALAKLGLKVAV